PDGVIRSAHRAEGGYGRPPDGGRLTGGPARGWATARVRGAGSSVGGAAGAGMEDGHVPQRRVVPGTRGRQLRAALRERAAWLRQAPGGRLRVAGRPGHGPAAGRAGTGAGPDPRHVGPAAEAPG